MKIHPVTRRTFLKGTAAAAILGPQIVPASVLGLGETTAPSERVTLAHIGVGSRGTAVQKEFMQLDDVQSIVACDPFRSRREEAANRINAYYSDKWPSGEYKSCEAVRHFEEVLAREDVDAVVVATPDHWHVPIAIQAARAGKDMYVEKPLGVSLEQDCVLRKEIETRGTIFQYGTQQRSERNFRFACELVRNGRIGDLVRVDVWCPLGGSGGSTVPAPIPAGLDYDLWLGPAPYATYTSDRCQNRAAFWVYDYSLGFVAGWGVHPLDIAQWGMDADNTGPVEVYGTGVIPTSGLFNTIVSWDHQLRYANGVDIHFMSSDIGAPIIEAYRPTKDHGTTFFGTRGWVSVDRSHLFTEPASLLDSEIGPDEVHLYESDNHRRNFIDCIKNRQPTICPIGGAVRVDTISHLCDIAARTGRAIKWDPEKEAILDDAEAAAMLTRPMREPWRL